MANRLPGPTLDEVPGDKPAPGITRPSLTDNSWSEAGGSAPRGMANEGMDVGFPREPNRRSVTDKSSLR